LSTNERYLVEHTEIDSYWADGYTDINEIGQGKNMLGILLMKVRAELKASG